MVCDQLDERRLRGLVMIGVDEISYRRGPRYLTCVADHVTGAIVWIRPARNQATLGALLDALGEAGRASIHAVLIDMTGGYENTTLGQRGAGLAASRLAHSPIMIKEKAA